jgi:hypothetical protein
MDEDIKNLVIEETKIPELIDEEKEIKILEQYRRLEHQKMMIKQKNKKKQRVKNKISQKSRKDNRRK